MARRLPQLVRRSLALAWRVDRRATIGLLLCQAVTGVMQALGLVAISGTLTALLTSGDVYQRLLQAWPSVALLAGTAGVRALLGGITVSWLSSRLGPLMSREAEQMLLTAAPRWSCAPMTSPTSTTTAKPPTAGGRKSLGT